MATKCPPHKESKGLHKRLRKIFGRGSQGMHPTRLNSPPSVVAVPSSDPLPPADPAPSVPTITTDPEEAAKIRAKYTHFRILVIGRANAGKTTLLKRVCNTKEDPVYSEVMYPLPLIPHSHHPFLDRLTPRQRCDLVILPHFSNHIIDSAMLARAP